MTAQISAATNSEKKIFPQRRQGKIEMFFGNGLIDKLSALASWRENPNRMMSISRKGAKAPRFEDFMNGIVIVKIS